MQPPAGHQADDAGEVWLIALQLQVAWYMVMVIMDVFLSLSVQHGKHVGGWVGVALSRIKITSITLQVNRSKYWGRKCRPD